MILATGESAMGLPTFIKNARINMKFVCATAEVTIRETSQGKEITAAKAYQKDGDQIGRIEAHVVVHPHG